MDETYLEQWRLWEKSCNMRIAGYNQNIRTLEADIELSKELIDLETKRLELETNDRDRGIAEREEYIKRESLG